MRETEKFRTEHLVARPWQIEDLPLAMELWGDPAVTALIDSRGKLTNAQVGEKLRLKTLLVTGNPDAMQVMTMAGVPYLEKPFRLRDLTRLIEDQLSSRSS